MAVKSLRAINVGRAFGLPARARQVADEPIRALFVAQALEALPPQTAAAWHQALVVTREVHTSDGSRMGAIALRADSFRRALQVHGLAHTVGTNRGIDAFYVLVTRLDAVPIAADLERRVAVFIRGAMPFIPGDNTGAERAELGPDGPTVLVAVALGAAASEAALAVDQPDSLAADRFAGDGSGDGRPAFGAPPFWGAALLKAAANPADGIRTALPVTRALLPADTIIAIRTVRTHAVAVAPGFADSQVRTPAFRRTVPVSVALDALAGQAAGARSEAWSTRVVIVRVRAIISIAGIASGVNSTIPIDQRLVGKRVAFR